MGFLRRFWPASLKGQVLLALAVALLLAQGLSAALLYRAEHERQESALLHTAVARITAATRWDAAMADSPHKMPPAGPQDRMPWQHDGFRIAQAEQSPLLPGEKRLSHDEDDLRAMLADQDIRAEELVVLRRPVARDPRARMRLKRRELRDHGPAIAPHEVMVVGLRLPGQSDWAVARVFVPPRERMLLATLLAQTLFIYAALVSIMALILRRITRPLALLTGRFERFAEAQDLQGQVQPEGPEDVRRLIGAHNAMEARIAALLDEKNVMLGAIGHDLKTPLAALRVRIESVEDEGERARMARTIEDITRTLDDILSLARVGRPSDATESTALAALVASVVEEYEDMGDPVVLEASQRLVLPVRPTWLRRALRNLIGNALRYGQQARVSLDRDGPWVRICIGDDGPGIPDDSIDAMMQPFTRGEPSRNSETGGAGLGLTLARAIAEQHGGTLTLSNRRAADGRIAGLDAVLRLPLG
jgi:signal transduction histidine kinase